jgi:hypothetical protein
MSNTQVKVRELNSEFSAKETNPRENNVVM